MVCYMDPRRAAQMDLWILLVLVIAGVAGSLEVHFENKDGGFFLKHDRSDPGDRSRALHHLFSSPMHGGGQRRKDSDGGLDDPSRGTQDGLLSEEDDDDEGDDGAPKGPDDEEGGEAAILSVDRFAVFQTSRPISVRATYGPFSTKQTVPARYIVPDPIDAPLPPINPAIAVPVPGFPNATSLVATAPAQPHHPNLQLFLGQQPQTGPTSPLDLDPSSHNLDISAHLVTPEVPRDAPVLRVLFHTGQQAASSSASSGPGLSPPPSLLPQGDKPTRRGGRRQYQQHAAAAGGSRVPPSAPHAPTTKQPRVCIVLYASLEEGRGNAERPPTPGPLSAACSPDAEEADGACVAQVTIPASWWPPLPPPLPPVPQEAHVDGDDILPEGPNSHQRQSMPQNPPKMPRVKVHAAFSVFEPRGGEGCVPTPGSRVQIQPVTPIGPSATLVAARAPYRELRADDRLSMLLPHAPLYPLSRVHVPVFITARPGEKVSAFVLRARVKSGVRILGAEPSVGRRWTVSVELSPKQTVATVTVFRKDSASGPEGPDSMAPGDAGASAGEDAKYGGVLSLRGRGGSQHHGHHVHHSGGKKKWAAGVLSQRNYGPGNQIRVEEVFSWLLEVDESAALWEGGKIVWGVRFVRDTTSSSVSSPTYPVAGAMDASTGGGRGSSLRPSVTMLHRGHSFHGDGVIPVGGEERRKLATRLEIQKDDVQAVLPISKNWEVMNTAILTGKQVSQAMKVFIVSQAGKVADVTLQSSCHSGEESVLKVSSSCSSVYVDGTELRGSTNATVVVAYGTHVGVARFTVWVPEMPLEVAVADPRLSQIKGWRVVDEAKSLTPAASPRLISTSGDGKRLIDELDPRRSGESPQTGMYRNWGSLGKKGGMEQQEQPVPERHICRLRFQQSPVEVYSRFYAQDHDSGRVSYFISRRTWLRVTDLVLALLRVSDTRIASLDGRILQGQSTGRTEVQVLSPISGRVVGAKEVRVGNDKVTILKLGVRVVSGLQLSITPDGSIENGYIAETSITRKLTAQYQEGLLDIDVEFSDGTRTPLRQVSVTDYQLAVDSLDTDVVAFAPMLASPHPRVIAVGEGRGDLLHISLLLPERCPRARATPANVQSGSLSSATLRRKSGSSALQQPQYTQTQPLASAYARVEVHFVRPDSALRPDFVQNDGGGDGSLGGSLSGHGGMKGGYKGRDGRIPPDLQDILIGIPLKDENDHEPTVQARQHVSNSGGVGGASSSSTAGARSGHRMHMTPLEIGMYVLLGAFCFAIVVFVVSCVVYASRFKEVGAPGMGGNMNLGLGGGLGGSSLGGLGNGAVNMGKLGRGGGAKRESTTNAHDWVWLGRATLERASGMGVGRSFGQSEGNDIEAIRITTNPNYREDAAAAMGESAVVSTTVFEVTHNQGLRPSIDTSTYCKGNSGRANDPLNLQQHQQNNAGGFVEIDKAWMKGGGGRGGDGLPPTPPPHGLPDNAPQVGFVIEGDGAVEYRPPVPPHRNIGVARIGPVRTQAPTPGFREVSVHPGHGKESSDVSSPSPPPPPPPKERRCRKENGSSNHDGSEAPWVGGVRVLPRSDGGSPAASRGGGGAGRHHHHHHHHHKHHKNHSESSGTEANQKSNNLNGQTRFQLKAPHLISRDSRESSSQREDGVGRRGRGEENTSAIRTTRDDSESTADEEVVAVSPGKKQQDHGDSFRRDLGIVAQRSDEAQEPIFAIYADSEASGYSSNGAVQEVGEKDVDSSQEDASDMSQANIVGNPMFSDPKEFERKRQLLLQSRKFGGQTEVGRPKEQRCWEDSKEGGHANGHCSSQQTSPYNKKDVDLDLDLLMDYRKIMEYFDSLKESNA
ncbi:uncharacterized protein LOC124158549 isoform X2 [Ischnura elegans]|uniref:uncharacterized protein LOC124158549 isoform X2 n=1 Tax=Ischnura elegans TaxID=197161 RepID=UPI001ED88C9F|nr:uncharacterized protein LOC124158549 isoform X2 [Ischnura elegans]